MSGIGRPQAFTVTLTPEPICTRAGTPSYDPGGPPSPRQWACSAAGPSRPPVAGSRPHAHVLAPHRDLATPGGWRRRHGSAPHANTACQVARGMACASDLRITLRLTLHHQGCRMLNGLLSKLAPVASSVSGMTIQTLNDGLWNFGPFHSALGSLGPRGSAT